MEKHSHQSEEKIQIYTYNLQQEIKNFAIQRITFQWQEQLREQLAALQNPEDQIVIQSEEVIEEEKLQTQQ